MEQTLLLNATYEPLTIVDWQRAITLWCSGRSRSSPSTIRRTSASWRDYLYWNAELET